MTNSFTTNDGSGDEVGEQSPEAQNPDLHENATVRELAVGNQQEARDEYVKDLEYQRRYTPATALSVGFKQLRDGGVVTGFQIVFDKETSARKGSAGDVSHVVEEVTSKIVSGIESGIAQVEHATNEMVERVSDILNPDRSHPRSQHTPDDVVDPFEMPMRGEWVEGDQSATVDSVPGASAIKIDPFEMPMRGPWVQGHGADTATDVVRQDDPYQMPMRGEWAHLADYQREMSKVQEKAASDEKFRQLAEDLKKSGDFVLGGKAAKIDASEVQSLPPLPKPIMPVAHDLPMPQPLPKPILSASHDGVSPPPLPKPIMPVAHDVPMSQPLPTPIPSALHDDVTPLPLPKPTMPVAHEVPMPSPLPNPIHTVPHDHVALPPVPKPMVSNAHDIPMPQPLPKSVLPLAAALPTIEPVAMSSQPEVARLPQITPRQLASPLPVNMVPQPIHLSTNDSSPIFPRQHLSENVSVGPAPVAIESPHRANPSPVPVAQNFARSDAPPPPTPTRAKPSNVVESVLLPVGTAPLEPIRGGVKDFEPQGPVPNVRREEAPVVDAPHVQKVESITPPKVFSLGVQDNHTIQQAPQKPYASIYSLPDADRMRLTGAAENQGGLKRNLQTGVSDRGQRRPVLSAGAEQSGHLERPMYGHYACSNGKDSFEMNLTLPPGASKNGPISTTVGGFLNVNRQRVVSSTQLDGRIVTDANGTRYEGSLATYTGGQLKFTAEQVVIPFRAR